ncbi:MAG: OsmC family protein [Pseudonocardiales bacterium]|nr:OsmC family protein [Pseudonocardiales bacterium]
MTTRSVDATWDGGLRCRVSAGRFELIVDEPESVGGTDQGPQPTELLLASVASCFTLAMAYSAGKRGVELAGLRVRATGDYDGPSFSAIRLSVQADAPDTDGLRRLVPAAERLCYVTNTLRRNPNVTVDVGLS